MGTLLNGKYEILKEIGRGGVSTVYLSMDVSLNKQWAIKAVKRGNDRVSMALYEAALKEATLMKNLDYPTLPRIVDIFEEGDSFFVVMDYIDGEPLSRLVARFGKLSESKVIYIARKLTDTLIYLHSRTPPIIHRDLKPGNIMITGDGNIKLIDFGIAREYKEENKSDTTYLGTKGYAAPEQFSGNGQTDARTDIYALGVTIYTLITGKNPAKPPYEIYPIRHWDKSLSRGLESIVLKCTKDNPNERYSSAAELKYSLTHVKEEDSYYLSIQKKKLNKFLLTSFIFLISFCFSLTSLFYGFHLKKNDFEQTMILAGKVSGYKEKSDLYIKAIEIKPGEYEAYNGLIDCFKEDARFSLEEEEIMNTKLNLNINFIKDTDDYGKLAYQLGKLYWYYYDYGTDSDNISGMKASVGWFEDACTFLPRNSKEYGTSLCYARIGRFNRDITLNIEEAEDAGKYKEYFYELKKLCEIAMGEKSEIVRLSAARLAVSSLDTYGGKFRQDGITLSEVESLFNRISEMLKNTEGTTEKTALIKKEISENLEYFLKSIFAAYDKEVSIEV